MTLPLALGMPGPLEMGFLLLIGLLFFGKRLPDVGRSIGQTIVQFKKGLADAEREAHNTTSTPQIAAKPTVESAEFKYDPHTGKPIERVS